VPGAMIIVPGPAAPGAGRRPGPGCQPEPGDPIMTILSSSHDHDHSNISVPVTVTGR
jgi:hypothetical protein